jgi:hypothetical protein
MLGRKCLRVIVASGPYWPSVGVMFQMQAIIGYILAYMWRLLLHSYQIVTEV